MNCFKQLQRFFSGLVALSFFVTNTLIPVPNAFAAAVESPTFISSFKIPAEFGKITDKVQGPAGSPLLIHIQEAHANYDAQKNIQNILGLLVRDYGILEIFLEGAGYQLKTDLFKFFPGEPDLQREVNDKLLQAGELTGAELFLLEQESATRNAQRATERQNSLSVERSTLTAPEAWGVEKAGTYAKDRQDFRRVFEGRMIANHFLVTAFQQWQKIATLSSNKLLRDFLVRENSFEEKRLPLADWMDFLKTEAVRYLKIDLADAREQKEWPVLARYFRLKTLGAKIDPAKAEKEKEAFLTDLKACSIPAELIQETSRFFEHKNDADLPPYKTRFAFEKLMDLLPEDYSFKVYPNVRLLIQQAILLSELQGDALRAEIKFLTGKITGSFVKTKEDERLVTALSDYRLLKKLFQLELSREEYQEIRRAKIAPEQLALELNLDFSNISMITTLFGTAIHFYEGAIEREDSMMERTVALMKEHKQTKAVLVTGGFHSEGMKEKAVKAGSSYVEITPRIGEVSADSNKNYLEALLGKRSVENSQIAAWVRSDVHFLKEVSPKKWRRELAGTGARMLEVLQAVRGMTRASARAAVSRFLKDAASEASGQSTVVSSTARAEIRENEELDELRGAIDEIAKGEGSGFDVLKQNVTAISRLREEARLHLKVLNAQAGPTSNEIASAKNFLSIFRSYVRERTRSEAREGKDLPALKRALKEIVEGKADGFDLLKEKPLDARDYPKAAGLHLKKLEIGSSPSEIASARNFLTAYQGYVSSLRRSALLKRDLTEISEGTADGFELLKAKPVDIWDYKEVAGLHLEKLRDGASQEQIAAAKNFLLSYRGYVRNLREFAPSVSKGVPRSEAREIRPFLGSFFVSADKKNRIIIPVAWRKLLGGDSNVMALSEEDGKRLRVYPFKTWPNIFFEGRTQDPAQARKHDDELLSRAMTLNLDAKGRVVLSAKMLNPEFLNTSTTYLLAGAGDSFLISPTRAEAQQTPSRSEMRDEQVAWDGIATAEERAALKGALNKEIDNKGAIIYEVNARQLFSDKKQKEPASASLWDAMTDEDLERIRDAGANVLWLMGAWKTSEFSRKFNEAWEKPESPGRVASAYSIDDYVLNPELGDEAAFRRLVIRANRKGLKVMLDFVPNHMAVDSVWVREHPEWFMQDGRRNAQQILNLEEYLPPVVSGPNGFAEAFCQRCLGSMQNFLVSVKDRIFRIAHGRGGLEDPEPWIDTAQLNLSHPGLQEKMKEVLSGIFDMTNDGGVRVDMAHYTLKEHINGAWLGPLGQKPMETGFWRTAITELIRKHPGILFVAEAYGENEGLLQELGMNFTYDKYLWELVAKGEKPVSSIVEHLMRASIGYLRRTVHFIENHDDPPGIRIANLLSPKQELAAMAIISAAAPGAVLLYDGQLEGHSRIKATANFIRLPNVEETTNPELLERSKHLLETTRSALFRKGEVKWPPAKSLEMSGSVLAVQRKLENERALVVVNYGPGTAQMQFAPEATQWGIPKNEASSYEWKDLLTGDIIPLEYDLTLEAWEYRVLVLQKKKLPHKVAKERAPKVRRGIEDYTVVSGQLEAGLDRGILEALNKKLSAHFPEAGAMIRRYVGLVSETTLTGGLGALMHDLFPAWAKNLGSQKKHQKDLIAVNAIYEEIKGQRYARYLPEEVKDRRTTLGDYVRSVLTPDRNLELSFTLEIGDDFRRKAAEEEAWAEREGSAEVKLAAHKAKQIIGRKVHVTVYPTETYYNQVPNYYIEAFFHDESGEKVRVFDEIYPDVPHGHPNLWRDIHMAVYGWAKQHLVQKLQEEGVVKNRILFVDNEVFVSTPTPMFPEAVHHHINHTVFRPGLYMPDEASYEMLGYPEILRKYIVRDGRIDIVNAIGVSSNLITGVALYEHTPVLAEDVMAGSVNKLKGYNEGGVRNTNGVFVEQWQSPLLRTLIRQYKERVGLGEEDSDDKLYGALRKPERVAELEEFKQKAEFIKAVHAAELFLWLKEDQNNSRWFDEMIGTYRQQAGLDTAGDQELVGNFRSGVEGALEDPEAWLSFMQNPEAVLFKETLLRTPVISNVRRQVSYKGPDKWLEIFRGLSHDPQALARFKAHAPRIIIGGREFGEEAHQMFLEIQRFVKDLGLEDKVTTIDDYNIYIAPIIYRGVSATIMLSDEFLEASATSMMKGIANMAALVGVWGGADPELFTIMDMETSQVMDVFRDKVTHDQLVDKLTRGLWKIKNGFLVEYGMREFSAIQGGGRRPSAQSLERALYDLTEYYQEPQSRRDLQFDVLAAVSKVDMAEGQAFAHKMLWEQTIRILQEEEELFDGLDVSIDDEKLFLSKSLAQPWQPEFSWHNTAQDAGNIRGIFGFIEGFRYLRMKGREGYNSIAYHASRGEQGDIFAYLDKFFQGFNATLTPLIRKIQELSERAKKAQSVREKVEANLEALEIIERLTVKISVDLFENYVRTQDRGLEEYLALPVLRENLSLHLEQSAFPFESIAKKIRGYSVELDGQKYLIALNLGEYALQGPKGQKAWGVLYGREAAEDLAGSTDDTGVYRVVDVISGANYGKYPLWKIAESFSVGAPFPGIQVMKLVDTGEKSEEQEVSLRNTVVNYLEALTNARLVSDGKPITQLLFQKIKEGIENPGKMTRMLSGVTSLSREKAVNKFGEKGIPSVMAFVAMLAPGRLDVIKEWNPEVYDKLYGVIHHSRFKDLFKDGKVWFHRVDRDSAVVISRSSSEGSAPQLVMPIHFPGVPFSPEDGKAGVLVLDVRNLGIRSSPDAMYQVRNILRDTFYPTVRSGADFHQQKWFLKVPLEEPQDPHVLREAPYRFQILEMVPLSSAPARSEIRGNGIEHVLVVDDSESDRELNRYLLKKWAAGRSKNLKIQMASSAEEALKILKAMQEAGETPDLVLTDWNMPGMSGPMLAQAIFARHIPTKVILNTSILPVGKDLGFYDDLLIKHGILVGIAEKADGSEKKQKKIKDLLDQVEASLTARSEVRKELPFSVQYQDQVRVVEKDLNGVLSEIKTLLRSVTKTSLEKRKPILFRGISASRDDDELFAMLGFAPAQTRKDVERQVLARMIEKIEADKGARFDRQGKNLTVFASGETWRLLLINGGYSKTFENFVGNQIRNGEERRRGIESFRTEVLVKATVVLSSSIQIRYELNDLEALAKEAGLKPELVKSLLITQAEYESLKAVRPAEKASEVDVRPIAALSQGSEVLQEVLTGIRKLWEERQAHWAVQRVSQETEALTRWDLKFQQANVPIRQMFEQRIQEMTKSAEARLAFLETNFGMGMEELATTIRTKQKEEEKEDLFDTHSYGEILRAETSVEGLLRRGEKTDAKRLRGQIKQVLAATVQLQGLIRGRTLSLNRVVVFNPHPELMYFFAKDTIQVNFLQKAVNLVAHSGDEELFDYTMEVLGRQPKLRVVTKPVEESPGGTAPRSGYVDRAPILEALEDLRQLTESRKAFYDQHSPLLAETAGRIYGDVLQQLQTLWGIEGGKEFSDQLRRVLDILATLWSNDDRGLWFRGMEKIPMPEAVKRQYHQTMDRILRPLFVDTSEEVDTFVFGGKEFAPTRSEIRTASAVPLAEISPEMDQLIDINEVLGGGGVKGFRGVTEKLTDGIYSMMALALGMTDRADGFFFPVARANETSSLAATPASINEPARFAAALKVLGVKTFNASDAFILGPEFALDHGAIAVMRTVFGDMPVVVLVRNHKDRAFIHELNGQLAKGNRPVILMADNLEQARALMDQEAAKLRGGKVTSFNMKAMVFSSEPLATLLREQIPDITFVTPKMFKNFLSLAGERISSLVQEVQAQFAVARSA